MKPFVRSFVPHVVRRFALAGLCTALTACSVLESGKVDYKSASRGPTLEVPPDLTQLARDSRYAVPAGPVTASGFSGLPVVSSPSAGGGPTALNSLGDVRIERSGNQRWLVVARPADQLWNPVREFWQDNGFVLTLDQASLGIMETDWAENRAKIPEDIIRRTLGRVLDSLYSTSERDRFRTRLERNATGGTEIYISHRGMQEVYAAGTRDQTQWTPRPSDPELEAEFLRRLMVRLGNTAEQARTAMTAAASPAIPSSRVVTLDNQPALQISEDFDRAWRRVGLALDRTGFTVEDRDRTQGTYFVRYVEPNADKQDSGFFGRLLGGFGGSRKEAAPLKFRIVVRGQGDASTVTVLNAAGAPENSANTQRIVKVLADDLR